MLKTALKGLLARKFRLLTTGVAVVLGVAFMAGTLIFTDTIGKTFDDLFATVSEGTDAQVRSDNVISTGDGDESRARLDEDLLETVQGVPGVAVAEGEVESIQTQIVGSDGDNVGNPAGGAPTFGRNWIVDDELNPFQIVEGRAPESDDEVVIDRFTADQGELEVGDRTDVIANVSVEVEVVGIATFGDTDSPGGTTNVMFATAAAQRYIGEPGKLDAVNVRADPGVSESQVRDDILAELPEGAEAEVLTGAEVTQEAQDDIAEGLGFFRSFLVAFAVLALFVGVFIIYNTFNILVAQRVREMALLRAVGASRRQVLGSVMLEAALVGLIAGGIGLVAGVGIAAGLKVLLSALNFDLPSGSLVVTTNTIVVAFVVGLVVSVVSALVPAVRASRVAPVAAMRDVAVDAPRSAARLVVGALVTAVSVFLLLNGLFGDVGNPLLVVGVGALGVVIGIAVLGPLFTGALSRLIGSPLPRLRGISGGLARQNAARNPSRTSTTAAALMIGVTLVAFITVVAASFKASFEETLTGAVKGDFVVDSGSFSANSGLPPELADQVRALPEVGQAASVRFLLVEIGGDGGTAIGAIDREVADDLFDVDLTEGEYADLDAEGLAVSVDKAEEEGLALGDTVPVRFVETGEQELTVKALFDNTDLVGDWFVGKPVSEANVARPFDFQVYVSLAQGVTLSEGREALDEVVDEYPTATLQDQQEYRDAQTAPIDLILNLVYALLSFSVIIALIGIANTLALSVLERTRELGLLRAVGMTRPQMRSMVRWESVIIALLGTSVGIVLGAFFGWATVTAVADEGLGVLRIPVPSLVIIAVIAALCGVWAARRPAKRAAKLDVLQAIASQ